MAEHNPVGLADKPAPLIHVIFSPSGAGTLRQALADRGRSEEVVCPEDDFNFGPIGSNEGERAAWVAETLGYTDWHEVVAESAPFLAASCSSDCLPVAWISRRDTQSHAGFLWWISHRNAPCRIIDVTDLAIGRLVVSPSLLTRDQMLQLLDSHVDLEPNLRTTYLAKWNRLAEENAALRVLDANGALASAPISHFDPLLLSFVTNQWKKMALVVGQALGSFVEQDCRQTDDLVLASRLSALAEAGALDWRGDLSSMRTCELRLPQT